MRERRWHLKDNPEGSNRRRRGRGRLLWIGIRVAVYEQMILYLGPLVGVESTTSSSRWLAPSSGTECRIGGYGVT